MMCSKLDLERKRAFVRAARREILHASETRDDVRRPRRRARVHRRRYPSSVRRRHRAHRFHRFQSRLARVVGRVRSRILPAARDDCFRTTRRRGFRVPDAVVAEAEDAGVDLRAGVHAASHAILNALPLRVPCGDDDVGCECFVPDLRRLVQPSTPLRRFVSFSTTVTSAASASPRAPPKSYPSSCATPSTSCRRANANEPTGVRDACRENRARADLRNARVRRDARASCSSARETL